MKVAVVYFSATGNTARIGHTIGAEFDMNGIETTIIDITPHGIRDDTLNLDAFDALVFGFPVYASVIPKVCREWIQTIKGKNRFCAMYFTYGGPTVGIVHYHTKILLKRRRFRVVASAEFPCKHSFNFAKGFNFLENRPNKRDFKVAKKYARKIIKLFNDPNVKEMKIKRPTGAGKILNRIKSQPDKVLTIVPTRGDTDCSMCRTCEITCSTGAFNADDGFADNKKCILCMNCVDRCPDEVISFDKDMSDSYRRLKHQYQLKDKKIRKLKSKIL